MPWQSAISEETKALGIRMSRSEKLIWTRLVLLRTSGEMDQEGIDEERGDLGSPTLAENSSRMGRPDF
jgi:hypothetical protein